MPHLQPYHNSHKRKMEKSEFIKWIYPSAKGGEISPVFTIAQAALETGWGNSKIGKYNLFGVTKGSSWTGKTILVLTHEVFSVPNKKFVAPERVVSVQNITIRGIRKYRYTVYRQFRDYDSLTDALSDHQVILMSKGYRDAWPYRKDPVKYAQKIVDGVGCKYATDPNYLKSILQIINTVKKELG